MIVKRISFLFIFSIVLASLCCGGKTKNKAATNISDTRIAVYIGDELYPDGTTGPATTVTTLQQSPLTSPILGLVNYNQSTNSLVFNDGSRDIFNITGEYIGSSEWPALIQSLRGGNIRELYLSFSTSGSGFMGKLISSNPAAAAKILSYIKNNLGFDGIDLDYEGSDFSTTSPVYTVALAAINVGLKVTAAPYWGKENWQSWVTYVQANNGTVSWLNLQCYSGGNFNNPGDWLDLGVPIVAGSCANCGAICTPVDMQNLFTLWRTGQSPAPISASCWGGTPNTSPQAIGGGFIWVYDAIAGTQFLPYMNALKTGLGM
ncbi:MAG: hypothetical protein ABUK01_10640 [Leptospirales bacterium]